jgi:uncharacterized protein YtpQ (UPF0354 family)
VQVTRTSFLPLLVSLRGAHPRGTILDDYLDDVGVGYSFGPPYGARLVTWTDLERLGLSGKGLRQTAARQLDVMLDHVQLHGRPPVLMLSFGAIGSSLLLAEGFWERAAYSVPGDVVVGAPAQDVIMMTGSASRQGVERIRRAVDRLFFAGGGGLLMRDLLVRRDGQWEVL